MIQLFLVRVNAANHPNATHKNIDKALVDSDNYVRLIAAQHPNATKAHVTKALNDSDSYVR